MHDHKGVGGQPLRVPISPISNSKGLAGRTLSLLIIPILWVLMSVFMTVLSFMRMKADAGESWGTLMSWWLSLVGQAPFYAIVFPSVACIGIITLMEVARSK
jgi:uncharacterized membrane protein YkvI